MIRTILLIGTGSFIGGVVRFFLSRLIQAQSATIFPWGTFAVNVIGSFLIGVLFGLSLRDGGLSTSWKLFLITGICGGFTTFSSFSLENLELLQMGEINQFILYAGISVIMALAATYAGYWVMKPL